jgi:hypothetical protein
MAGRTALSGHGQHHAINPGILLDSSYDTPSGFLIVLVFISRIIPQPVANVKPPSRKNPFFFENGIS